MPYSKELGLMDMYKFYKSKMIKKNLEYKDYKTFSKVIKTFNSKFKDKVVYDVEKIKLPRKLGEIYISKYENTFDMNDKNKRLVNYYETKKAGYVIYHEDQYGYKWKWDKKHCIVIGKKYYQFKPCRSASRSIANAIKNKKIDYYN